MLGIKDRWTSGAGYDQWMGRWSRLLAHEFLDWLALPMGLRWIDICCGSAIPASASPAINPAAVKSEKAMIAVGRSAPRDPATLGKRIRGAGQQVPAPGRWEVTPCGTRSPW